MKLWNYIGEFFLFRWLFGKLPQRKHYNFPVSNSNDYHGYSTKPYHDKDPEWDNGQSYDDFHEEQDDYDMMDDF